MMPTTDRHIIALGGGGFSMVEPNPESSLIDTYILRLTGKRRPRVCFVPTASGDSVEYCTKFLKAFRRRADASVLQLFRRDDSSGSPREHLLAQDIIYVGGGNTANLLAVWRLHGVDRAMRAAHRNGVILCGISAGMNCWFQRCSTDSFGPLSLLDDGLGLLPGCACPHYDGESQRRPTLRAMVARGHGPAYAADNFAALHFVGRSLHAVVAERANSHGWFLKRLPDGEVIEAPLPAELLTGRALISR